MNSQHAHTDSKCCSVSKTEYNLWFLRFLMNRNKLDFIDLVLRIFVPFYIFKLPLYVLNKITKPNLILKYIVRYTLYFELMETNTANVTTKTIMS